MGDGLRFVREITGMILHDDIFDNIERLRLPSEQMEMPPVATPKGSPSSSKPKRIKGEFLKGPIPLAWLTVASKLSGKASLAVALAIWFEAGRRKSKVVKLTSAILERFNVSRKCKYRALKSLEKAGLIRVHREPRRNPVVTIMEIQGEQDADGIRQDVTGTASAGSEQQCDSGDNQVGGT